MIVGFDLNDTITAFPQEFRALADCVLSNDGQVHIVTAIKKGNEEYVERKLAASRVQYTKLHIIHFEDYNDIPKLKLPIIKNLGIEMYFDDNPGVNFLLSTSGILACTVQGMSKKGVVREY